MRWPFRSRRSGGIRVDRRTHRQIARGDAARDRSQWAEAVDHYRQALAIAPDLAHINIQLGHALKESGGLEEAETAYGAALRLAPTDREPHLHLAHTARLRGDHRRSAFHYARLLDLDIEDDEAAAELARTLRHLDEPARRGVLEGLQSSLPEALRMPVQRRCGDDDQRTTIMFDISDLIGFFSHSRRPTGIQRVQLETVKAALTWQGDGVDVAICCMSESDDRWRELSVHSFGALAALSAGGDADDGEWRRVRSTLRLGLMLAPPISFRDDTVLVNLGASWWLGNYFLALRDIQSRRRVVYLPFIHDLIPIFQPAYHTRALIVEFINWLVPAMDHAAAFLVNSRATGRDLEQAIALRASGLAPLITVVPLDAAFSGGPAGRVKTDPTIVVAEPFVLFVGTIEPRKGHASAFDAWSLLLRQRHPPLLVCVGRPGWEHDAIFARLDADVALAERVLILSDVDDVTLDGLYRRAMFTLYPSRYEGWGLPVTESLSRGRVVITTTASALPEAGGALALYVPPDDPAALAGMVGTLLDDPSIVRDREQRIAAEFAPRAWSDIAEQVIEAAGRLAADGPDAVRPSAPIAEAGRFYSLGRIGEASLCPEIPEGEGFRAGMGWRWPESWGCRIGGPGDSGLALRVDPADAAETLGGWRILVLVRGVGDRRCRWRIVADDEHSITGTLDPSQRLWLDVAASGGAGRIVALQISSDAVPPADDAEAAVDQPDLAASGDLLGVEGFFCLPTARATEMEPLQTAIMAALGAAADSEPIG